MGSNPNPFFKKERFSWKITDFQDMKTFLSFHRDPKEKLLRIPSGPNLFMSIEVENMDERLSKIIDEINVLLGDHSIPKNIKKALSESKDKLTSDDEWNVKLSSAIYHINNISEDMNMPTHARMQIWTVMSELEALKE